MSGYQQISNDLKELLELLLSHQVDFVVIGAHAVALHARPRFAELRIFVSSSQRNVDRLAAVMDAFEVKLTEGSLDLLASHARAMLSVGEPPCVVEISNFADGLEFGLSRARAEVHELRGVRIPLLCLADLVQTKRASNRPKDQFDLAMLREVHGVLPGDEAESG